MKSFSKMLCFIFLPAAALLSCQMIEDSVSASDELASEMVNIDFVTTEGHTVLGDVIDIPYSIENLLKAYENLPAQTKSQIDLEDIQPTHYYVRFYPKSIEEQDILRNIKPYVFLSETPLDRKVVVGGSSYHDPSIPADLPTFQYTVVPVARWAELEKTVPVEAEILIKAFIPDYDDDYTTKSEARYGIPVAAYDALLREAYIMTGNELPEPLTKGESWNPSGRIRAYDDETTSYIPVPGVRIRGTHLLKVKETMTNSMGLFTLESFNSSVSLKVVWESDDWDIRDGQTGQATFDGPSLNNQTWMLDIGVNHEKNVRYAAIQRATYRYYYGDNDGLIRPAFTGKLKICQKDSYDECAFVHNDNTGIHRIDIFIKQSNNSYSPINLIFFHTAHELGHAAQYSVVRDSYDEYCQSIRESWGVFTAYILFNKEYGYLPNIFSFWPNPIDPTSPSTTFIFYTPIFVDLYDNYNQHNVISNCPTDTVSGYSPYDINLILLLSRDLNALKYNAVQHLPIGVTTDMMNSLFSVYDNYWYENQNI